MTKCKGNRKMNNNAVSEKLQTVSEKLQALGKNGVDTRQNDPENFLIRLIRLRDASTRDLTPRDLL